MSIFKSKPKTKRKGVTYDQFKRKVGNYNQEMVAVGQEIGDLPAIVNIKRRAACEKNLELFCKTYFPEVFCLTFSKTHKYVIGRLQHTAIKGDQMALAMPRGSGKTSI